MARSSSYIAGWGTTRPRAAPLLAGTIAHSARDGVCPDRLAELPVFRDACLVGPDDAFSAAIAVLELHQLERGRVPCWAARWRTIARVGEAAELAAGNEWKSP